MPDPLDDFLSYAKRVYKHTDPQTATPKEWDAEIQRLVKAAKLVDLKGRVTLDDLEKRVNDLWYKCMGIELHFAHWRNMLGTEWAKCSAPFDLERMSDEADQAYHRLLLVWERLGAGVEANTAEQKDGPEPPNLLWWNGTRHEVPPRLWQLLDFMWEKEKAQVEDVRKRVWGDEVEDPTDNAIRSAISRLNTHLEPTGIPWTLSYQQGYILKNL